ncbi:organic cation transporter protein-like isoform X2 [Anoplophora glabripennis]|uniref:organic cation transporter protein-like isoform X2 n=1 Tax=Anoplophora glabripennis TaxID=217634 RepID=UPI000873C79F|nr:organic cation transporter protein-like isoform X2 [Anoplophora glabripennis]
MSTSAIDNSLDSILVEIGDFGKYQIYVFVLVCIPVVLHSSVHVAYVFTAMDLTYRCGIPECDQDSTDYEPPWLINAVPYTQGIPNKCDMYLYNSTAEAANETCSASDFDKNEVSRCSSFIYKTDEESILQEYNLQCSDNLWKLTLVGTVNSFGQFSGLLIAGMLSDRYGRRRVMVWGMVLCAICGLIRTVMPTYELFLLMEYLDAAFSAGTFICGYILGVELVGPKNRVITGSIATSCNATGFILTSVVAWIVRSWRMIIYILYTLPFFLILYLWIVPESIRWNIKKGRIDEAKVTLRKLAKVNGKEISERTLDKLNIVDDKQQNESGNQFFLSLKSPVLLLRFMNACFGWITCAFVFYGLSINSVTLASGNKYMNFILSSLVEIPAYFLCPFLLSYFGRKKSLFGFYVLAGVACVAFIFIPSSATEISLTVYMIGKFGSTATFAIIYQLTSEMFPTTTRQSYMGACSTFGRLGVMVAPQMPLLVRTSIVI